MSRNLSNIELQRLARKVMDGTASDEEFELLNRWYSSFDDTHVRLDDDRSRAEIHDSLRRKVKQPVSSREALSRSALRFSRIAAVISVLLISASIWYFTGLSDPAPQPKSVASLELKTTLWGQKRTIELPDGSVVKLNSGSSIEYPAVFGDGERRVKLEGEAFFNVTKDTNRPFVVETSSLSVAVLGTSFNVKCYKTDQQIDVAVKTGKVKVTSTATAEYVTLLPDEAATYQPGSRVIRKEKITDPAEVFGWVDGHLILRDQDFQQVIKTLSRWYGVEFEIGKSFAVNKRITAECDNSSLKEVLESLSHNYEFEYEIKGKVITIK